MPGGVCADAAGNPNAAAAHFSRTYDSVQPTPTHRELAERVGVALTNLSLLKTGKVKAIRFSTLEAICEVLKCQPGDLLEYSEK